MKDFFLAYFPWHPREWTTTCIENAYWFIASSAIERGNTQLYATTVKFFLLSRPADLLFPFPLFLRDFSRSRSSISEMTGNKFFSFHTWVCIFFSQSSRIQIRKGEKQRECISRLSSSSSSPVLTKHTLKEGKERRRRTLGWQQALFSIQSKERAERGERKKKKSPSLGFSQRDDGGVAGSGSRHDLWTPFIFFHSSGKCTFVRSFGLGDKRNGRIENAQMSFVLSLSPPLDALPLFDSFFFIPWARPRFPFIDCGVILDVHDKRRKDDCFPPDLRQKQ